MMATRALALLFSIASIACLGNGTGPQLAGSGRRVLFIGNSHTFVNDVPGLLQALAAARSESLAVATIRSYELAAEDASGMLFPAAAAFRLALQRDPTLPLYADGTHASAAGSYLTAVVMYAAIFKKTPVGLPLTVRTLNGTSVSIPPAMGALLQETAADVVLRGLGGSEGVDGPAITNPGTC